MNATTVTVRFERKGDAGAIRQVNLDAFGRATEADLVDALRRSGQAVASLVAELKHAVVGHLLLTPVSIMPTVPGFRALGLGPVAVSPSHQRQGIGFLLVHQALRQAEREGWHAIVVLGDPAYYTRFGFVPARLYGLGCEFSAPEDGFMALELCPGILKGTRGVMRYQPEFSSPIANGHSPSGS